MFAPLFQLFLTTVLFFLMSGCAGHIDHTRLMAKTAQQFHVDAQAIATSQHTLQAFHPMSSTSKILRVYIEGDGRAWASRYRPSRDPTPDNLLVLQLMSVDTTRDKAYIARPCQFIMTEKCSTQIWTKQRYSKAAVDSLDEALDRLKLKGSYQQLELIGFSGGATLALILAATRDDVLSVRTIAGNLDPAFVNKIHSVSKMPEAMNPVHV